MDQQQIDVPDELTPEQQQAYKERLERLDAFSETIKKLRTTAIEARKSMGIEDQWQEDEDYYEAIDDATRTTSSRTKPYDFGGTGTGPTRTPDQGNTARSTIFVPMTRPYVDAAAARIADMYLPTDDRNWDGEPTPIPDLVDLAKSAPVQVEVVAPAQKPTLMDRMRGFFGGVPQAAPQPMSQDMATEAQKQIDAANKAWEKARTRIDDWLEECDYNAELRKCIKDAARIGVCVLKGPHPKVKTSRAAVKTPGGFAIEMQEKTVPTSRRIDPWRFFPDPACGEDVNSGSYVFEQDFITRSKLRDLKKMGGYIAEQIDACLDEGPINSTTGTKKNPVKDRSEADLFEIWYFEGQVEWQDLEDAGCHVDGEKGDVFHAVVTMVNDRVVKAALSHLDSGEFTYDVMVWQRKSGLWIGDGIARQGRTAQRGLNAAVRALMDNAGQSCKPHKVINRGVIRQGGDPWTWEMTGEGEAADVRTAMMFFQMPSVQEQLMNIINYFMKMFEDATGMPMIMQGLQGSAPDTVGGMELLQNNAGIVPRDIVRRLDDSLTEPHINRYYEYLLIHGEDDSEKGDFQIHARGSSALMERAAQDQFLLQIGNFVTNPAFDLDPALYIEELLKSKRINPQRLKLSDEKKKEIAARGVPEDPRVTAAKIMADATMKKAAQDAKVKEDALVADAQMQAHQQQFEAQENEKDRQIDIAVKMIEEKMQTVELSSVERQALDKIKAGLTDTAIKLRTEKELAAASMTVDLHKDKSPPPVMEPPVQVPGRADNGHAFDQTNT